MQIIGFQLMLSGFNYFFALFGNILILEKLENTYLFLGERFFCQIDTGIFCKGPTQKILKKKIKNTPMLILFRIVQGFQNISGLSVRRLLKWQ